MIKLSILIATMPPRVSQLNNLYKSIVIQTGAFTVSDIIDGCFIYTREDIELIIDPSMAYNVGTKRNKLLKRATGDYVVYIDDDDTISPDYIAKILTATETNPDCIGISGTITFNGSNRRQWHISKQYGHWYEYNGIYYRTPNHISPVRRELALQVGFPEISFGEDAEYSRRLLPLLKTEIVVPGNLYEYRYVTK